MGLAWHQHRSGLSLSAAAAVYEMGRRCVRAHVVSHTLDTRSGLCSDARAVPPAQFLRTVGPGGQERCSKNGIARCVRVWTEPSDCCCPLSSVSSLFCASSWRIAMRCITNRQCSSKARKTILLSHYFIPIFQAGFPHAPVIQLEHVGHFCQEDPPETLVAHLEHFIYFTA